MANEVKLADMIDTINGMNDVDSIKSYCLSIISTLQKELQNTKSSVVDFRNSYGLDTSEPKSKVLNVFVDPVLNAEICRLKEQIQMLNEEIKHFKDLFDIKEYTSESTLGRHLVEKIRVLQVENNELTKAVADTHVQPLSLELLREKERNKVLDKKLTSLHLLNTQLRKDNSYLSQRVEDLGGDSSRTKRDYDSVSKKSDRHTDRSDSFGRSEGRSRRSPSPKRPSDGARRSPSPKRKDRGLRSSSYSRHSDRPSDHRTANRPPSRDRSRNRAPRPRH